MTKEIEEIYHPPQEKIFLFKCNFLQLFKNKRAKINQWFLRPVLNILYCLWQMNNIIKISLKLKMRCWWCETQKLFWSRKRSRSMIKWIYLRHRQNLALFFHRIWQNGIFCFHVQPIKEKDNKFYVTKMSTNHNL